MITYYLMDTIKSGYNGVILSATAKHKGGQLSITLNVSGDRAFVKVQGEEIDHPDPQDVILEEFTEVEQKDWANTVFQTAEWQSEEA